ncbi:MAG: hypothetical protein ABI600_05290 [Luteolibacter sp.]
MSPDFNYRVHGKYSAGFPPPMLVMHLLCFPYAGFMVIAFGVDIGFAITASDKEPLRLHGGRE